MGEVKLNSSQQNYKKEYNNKYNAGSSGEGNPAATTVSGVGYP